MGAGGIVGLLVLAAVVLTITVVVQRAMKKGQGSATGADIVPYLVLALAMGVAGFGMAELAGAAFPTDQFVFDPAERIATSLAALVVSVPFLIYFWRRQSDRRELFPASPGWTLYLTIVQAVFLTAFAVSAVMFVNGLITDQKASDWTDLLIFGAILVFHDIAARRTPPLSDAHDLPRIAGAAIGLITGSIGLAGSITAAFDIPIGSMSVDFDPWLAMAIVGLPVWAFYWFRAWDEDPSVPRLTWTVLVSIASGTAALTAFTTMAVLVTQYILANTPTAGVHFELAPAWLASLITATGVWGVHRRALGSRRRDSLRAYEYALAAIALAASVVTAIGLTLIALDTSLIVGGGTADVIAMAFPLVVALVVWRYFTTRSWKGDFEEEATAWPRRFYHLGAGVIFALASAVSLIILVFTLLRRLLSDTASGSLLEPVTVLVYTGLAAWYLLAGYARDREVEEDETVVTPFEVTVVCSHPGPIALRFSKQARLRIIHRGDDVGLIDEETADAIVAEVANRSSIVWVDDEGFKVAPALRV